MSRLRRPVLNCFFVFVGFFPLLAEIVLFCRYVINRLGGGDDLIVLVALLVVSEDLSMCETMKKPGRCVPIIKRYNARVCC